MEINFLLTNTLKKKNTVVYGTTPEEDLLNVAEDLRFPKRQANLHIMVYGKTNERKKKRDKAIRMRPAPLGGNCEGGKVSTHSETPSCGGMGGWSLGTSRTVQQQMCGSKAERILLRDWCCLALPSLRLVNACPLGWMETGC